MYLYHQPLTNQEKYSTFRNLTGDIKMTARITFTLAKAPYPEHLCEACKVAVVAKSTCPGRLNGTIGMYPLNA